MAKPGRKPVKIDWEIVKDYLRAQCAAEGIAGILGISRGSLYGRCVKDLGMEFDELRHEMRESGKEMIRKKQFDLAAEGDKGMLIWLGKQYLGQSDKTDMTTEIKSELPVTISIKRNGTE